MHMEKFQMDQIITRRRIELAEAVGIGILRYSVAFLLLFIGALKFFEFEANAIQPLVAHSPFLSWMYGVFSIQGASNFIGTIEIVTGLLIGSRRFAPLASAVGSGMAVVIFATTLSFLFSTPGALSPMHPASGFLMKDLVLLGASVATGAEALRAAQGSRARGRASDDAPASRVASV
jgi:reactive chlorine resistance protein C